MEEHAVRRDEWQFRSEEHTSELQSHSDLPCFPTRRSSDLKNGVVFQTSNTPPTFPLVLDTSFYNVGATITHAAVTSCPDDPTVRPFFGPSCAAGIWKNTRYAATNGNSDRKSTRLNSSHTVIYPVSLHDALPILRTASCFKPAIRRPLFRSSSTRASITLERPLPTRR